MKELEWYLCKEKFQSKQMNKFYKEKSDLAQLYQRQLSSFPAEK